MHQGVAMAHDHHHHDHETDAYFLDQLCLVGVSGAFALICITLYFWQTAMLKLLLAPQFHDAVLLSGVALGVLVLARAVVLWRMAGTRRPHAHDHHHHHDHDHTDHHHHHDHAHSHSHEHDHGHFPNDVHHGHATGETHEHDHVHASHGPHGHEHCHDHDHDHSWAPWRYVVLLIPIALYLLGQPDEPPTGRDTSQGAAAREAAAWIALASAGPLPWHQTSLAATILVDPFARETPVYLAGKPVTLDELEKQWKPNMPVSLRLFEDRRVVLETVQEVHADPAKPLEGRGLRHGTIESVNAAEKLLTVAIEKDGVKEKKVFDLALGPPYGMDFKALESLSRDRNSRRDYAGKTVQVSGQFAPSPYNVRVFTLMRQRINCCAADAVQLNVWIISREPIKGLKPSQWIQVTGRVEFQETQPGRYQTVLRVSRPNYVVPTRADPDVYVQ
jgi:hypothetical protein